MTKQEILELLRQPYEVFAKEQFPLARDIVRREGDALYATAMLGFSNICKNRCLYCGMRARAALPRYRLSVSEVLSALSAARAEGFSRAFLVSGEDPSLPFADLVAMVEGAAALGLSVTLATGELPPEGYAALKAAGATEYAMKFEMGDAETFDRLNPSTTFAKRMAAIEAVQRSGLALASGNIVDYPGQTLEQLADEILLTASLQVSWAPIVPYMPAPGTPLAETGHRGDRRLCLREIAILRRFLPKARITAQQPGEDLKAGLATEEGNLDALRAGADILFCDLLPEARAKAFAVVGERRLAGLPHLHHMAALDGRKLRL